MSGQEEGLLRRRGNGDANDVENFQVFSGLSLYLRVQELLR